VCSSDLMTGMKHVYATFDVAVARLNVVTSGAGGGTVTGGGIACATGSLAGCSADVPLGAVTLTAAASPGSTFAGWAGACTGTAPTCTLALTGMKFVYATFDLPVARLTVVTRGSGAGTVTGAGVACASASSAGCAADVPLGATITLGATAGPGSAFAGWAGACTGTAPTCTVTMAAARYVFAAFDPGG